MKEKNIKIFKIIILLAFIAIMVFMTIWLVPIFKNISTEEGRINFKNDIEGLGAKGVFAIIGLMIIQIFLPILPRRTSRSISTECHIGPIGGLLVIFAGAFLCTALIFFAVRKFGRNFIYSFISKERIEKLENSKLFKDEKKINTILFILFFIPGTPKDLFVYIGGLLPVSPAKFLSISTFARFPSIISSTIAGSSLVDGNWTLIAITYGVTFLLAGIIAFVFSKKEKVKLSDVQ